MFSLLLDENLSPEIARQIVLKRPDISVSSIHNWNGGQFIAQTDEAILVAAAREGLTIVTCDQKTILPLLMQWGQAGTQHSGVVFIPRRSIATNDFGAIMNALITLWDSRHVDNWTNRIEFLKPKS